MGRKPDAFRHAGGLPGRIGKFTMEAGLPAQLQHTAFLFIPMTSPPSDSCDSLVIAALIENLQYDASRDGSSHLEAFDALAAMGSKAVPALIGALEQDERSVREAVVSVLGVIGPEAKEAVPALIAALKDMALRQVAIHALRAIGPAAKDAVPILIDALEQDECTEDLNEDEWSLREAAALVLAAIGPAAQEAVPALIAAIRERRSFRLWQVAVWALREIGPAAKDAIPELILSLRHFDYNYRCKDDVSQALGAIGKDAVPALVANLNDDRWDARFPLRAIGKEAVPYLLDILRHDRASAEMRGHVADTLEMIGKNAVPDLMAAWKDETGIIHYEAARILMRIDPDLIAGTSLKNEPAREDDERLLRWFDEFNLKDYQTDLQVFWCVGYVDREALQSAGTALGLKRLSQRLSEIDPHFKRKRLPRSIGYLRETCFESIYGLFDKEPFRSEAWSPEERTLEIRPGVKYKERDESRWTPKAWKAWQYVDRFLRMRKLLPTIISENSD